MLRTHTCGELSLSNKGEKVVLAGWVARKRKHGSLVFVDLRDRYGITQIVADEKDSGFNVLNTVPKESVLLIKGVVKERPKGTENPKIKTGEIEVEVEEAKILSKSKELPFEIESLNVNEDLRLKYRYLDLRKEKMKKNLELRSKIYNSVCRFLEKKGFLYIETPILAKSTPEGARDFLVPSRLHPGSFFALPQAPQQYKQLLMVAGIDKYYQLARCFRDEDLRADRQFEFTQIDIEMSFAEQEDVFNLIEELFKDIFEKAGYKIETPFPRISYKESMNRYGTDKPDLRFEMEIKDLNKIFENTEFEVFKNILNEKGHIKGLKYRGEISKKEQKKLLSLAQEKGGKGIVFMHLKDSVLESNISKFLKDNEKNKIIETLHLKEGDTACIVADKDWLTACTVAGIVRTFLGSKIEKKGMKFVWITDFPMFEYSKEFNRIQACHHPFTMPNFKKIDDITNKPMELNAKAYDIVLNGFELGGGSVRIHNRDVQFAVFEVLGLDKERAKKLFGHLLRAFKYGVPPHCGIALGFDRIIMLMAKEESLREVIAFPRNKSGINPMEDSPSEVSPEQLKELHLKLDFEKNKK